MRATVLATSLAAALALSGCSTVDANYGYVPSDIQLQDIKVGTDTKDTVSTKIGEPPLEDMRRPDVWYYVASQTKTWLWNPPKTIKREIVAVHFTSGGTVSNIERFGLDHAEVVVLSRRVTSDAVPDVGFLHGLFGNSQVRPDLGTPE